jgi:hypothetical protein
MSGSSHPMGGMDSAADTRTQLSAITGFTLLLLIAGMYVPAAFVNLGIRAEDVRGAIMPSRTRTEAPNITMLRLRLASTVSTKGTASMDRCREAVIR